MRERVTCPACGKQFEALAETDRWLSCPGCGRKVVNPAALQVGPSAAMTWTAVLGTFLVIGGVTGCVCFGFGTIFVAAFQGRGRRVVPGADSLLVSTLAFLFLAGAGLMLIRASQDRVRRAALLVAAVLAILAALALLITSGLLVIFVTCFTGQ